MSHLGTYQDWIALLEEISKFSLAAMQEPDTEAPEGSTVIGRVDGNEWIKRLFAYMQFMDFKIKELGPKPDESGYRSLRIKKGIADLMLDMAICQQFNWKKPPTGDIVICRNWMAVMMPREISMDMVVIGCCSCGSESEDSEEKPDGDNSPEKKPEHCDPEAPTAPLK